MEGKKRLSPSPSQRWEDAVGDRGKETGGEGEGGIGVALEVEVEVEGRCDWHWGGSHIESQILFKRNEKSFPCLHDRRQAARADCVRRDEIQI